MNPNEPIRDARKLGTPKMLVLGLQHMFAMFGATILVPILVQQYGLPLDIQTTLFFAGIGTLFFHVCTKFRVPAFLGSSFAFLGGFSTMANLNTGIYADMSPQDKLAYTCGGIVVAGLLYLALALVIRLVGVKKVMRFLPPVVTGPIIVCIGLTLAPSAVSNASTCWPLALIALATIIIFNIWGKGMFKIIPILMGVVVSYIAALIMNACGVTVLNAAGEAIPLIDFTAVREASILGLPPFQMAKFDLTAILVMAPIALACTAPWWATASPPPWPACSAAPPTPHMARIPASWSCPRSMTPGSSVWRPSMPSCSPLFPRWPTSSALCPPPSWAACPSFSTA